MVKNNNVFKSISGYKKLNYRITPSSYQATKEPLNALSITICCLLGAFKVLIASLARVVFYTNNTYSAEVRLYLLFCYASAFLQLCNFASEGLRRCFKPLQVVNDFIMNVNFYVTTFFLKISIFYIVLSFADARQQYTCGYLTDFFIFIITRIYTIKFRFSLLETTVALIFATGINVLTYCIVVPEHPGLFGAYCGSLFFNAIWAYGVDKYFERDYYYEMKHLTENQSMKAALVGKKAGIVRLINERVLNLTSYCIDNYDFLFDKTKKPLKEIEKEEAEILPIVPRSEDYPEVERFDYLKKEQKYLIKNFFFDLENSIIPDNIRKAEMSQVFQHIKNVNKSKNKPFKDFCEIGTKKIFIDSYTYKVLEFQLRVIEVNEEEDINNQEEDIFELLITDISNYEQYYRADNVDKDLLKSCIDKGLQIPLKTINIINENIKVSINSNNSSQLNNLKVFIKFYSLKCQTIFKCLMRFYTKI